MRLVPFRMRFASFGTRGARSLLFPDPCSLIPAPISISQALPRPEAIPSARSSPKKDLPEAVSPARRVMPDRGTICQSSHPCGRHCRRTSSAALIRFLGGSARSSEQGSALRKLVSFNVFSFHLSGNPYRAGSKPLQGRQGTGKRKNSRECGSSHSAPL